mgnify:CR=1 FL=1
MITPSRNRPVPVVVYGTLRTGGALNEYYLSGMHGEAVSIKDHALRVWDHHAAYPHMVPAKGEQTVGELFWIGDPHVFTRMRVMEENAGYRTEWVDVESTSHVIEVQALAFVYHRGDVTHPVPSNDWIQFTNANV